MNGTTNPTISAAGTGTGTGTGTGAGPDPGPGTAADTGILLEAGAILAPGSHTGEDADTLTARTYTHPVLPGRTVVRLVPETLGEAEDLALDFLGLHRETVTDGLGQVRRETLGFPAWALANDPANGHHALALVKDVERLARTAKSRAGAAKDGFDALGVRLGRSVPHFLPTFYEQAARIFLQHDNTTYAATFFGKAREAERVHGLAVDETRQRAVFLEFAFAGALTVKALKEHVRDLTQRLDPGTAWTQYRQLVVERGAAGMPPYAALPQDARKLVKAAGLPQDTEETRLLADLITSPAVTRAPGSFWKTYRPVLLTLAAQDPAVRARLLEIMPAGLEEDSTQREWLALLAESGAEALLTDPVAGAGTDAAGWLTTWATRIKHSWRGVHRSPGTYALVLRMAARLRADGRPVDLFRGSPWRAWADIDLLDLCLASGIPLTEPPHEPDKTVLGIDDWFGGPDEGRQDLAAVAADPRFAPLLRAAVGRDNDRSTGNRHLHRIARHPVLRAALSDWLDDRAQEFTATAGLPGARSVLDRVRAFGTVAAEVNPAAVARIAGHDLPLALANTLRAGILDELGWPALEEGLRLLGERPKDKRRHVVIEEAWPALIVCDGYKALVIGPDAVLLDHDLRIPDSPGRRDRPSLRYVGGELLVAWWTENGYRAYWSSRPADLFTMKSDQAWRGDHVSFPLPDGGRVTGGRILYAGDTTLPKEMPVIGDGLRHWRLRTSSSGSSWQEYDPATGTTGRDSLPAALAAGIREGGTLRATDSLLLPIQPGLENTPLGTDGTVLGHWVRDDGDRLTAGTPDGTTVSLPTPMSCGSHPVPRGTLRLPGGAAPVLAFEGGRAELHIQGATAQAGALARIQPGGPGGTYAAGTPMVPPPAFWHALRPRDEAGSKALRTLTDGRAGLLAEAFTTVHDRYRDPGKDDGQKARRATERTQAENAELTRLLPDLTHPGLREGVLALIRSMLELRRAVRRFTHPPAPGKPGAEAKRPAMFADHKPEHGSTSDIVTATRAVISEDLPGHYGGTNWTLLRQIKATNHVLSGAPATGTALTPDQHLDRLDGGWHSDPYTIPSGSFDWTVLLHHTAALTYRAASPLASQEARTGLLLLLDALAEGPLAERQDGAGLRRVVLVEKDHRKLRAGQVLRRDGRTVVILAKLRAEEENDRSHWTALDHDPTGAFGPVAHFTLRDAHRVPDGPTAERITAFTRLIRTAGPAPQPPEAVARLAAAPGCGPSQAALLIAGDPAIRSVQDAPTAQQFATIGLTARQAAAGAVRLQGLDGDGRRAVLISLLPQDPAALWETGPDTEAAVRAWTDHFGTLVHLPEDLDLTGLPATALSELLNPDHTPWLSRTTVQRPGKQQGMTAADPAAVPHGRHIVNAVQALASVAYALPYRHPLRRHLPAALSALRTRLADPGLLLDADIEWTEKLVNTTAVELRKAYGMPAAGGAGADGFTRVGEAFVLYPWYGEHEYTVLRPAGLTGPDDPALGLLEGITGHRSRSALDALRAVLGTELEHALRADAPATADGSEDAYCPQDPTRSVPHLVTQAAERHGLGADAAALYLQLLTLPDPTDRNCVSWTGWKPARAKKARTELAASGLVVEAKRARAGRSLFLPGGWEALGAPALPLETWKRDLYPIQDYGRTVPHLPVPELFARAWQRVVDGDGPAFEELVTRATTKGRRR